MRFIYALTYLLCIVAGAFIGFFAGSMVSTLVIGAVLPDSWEAAVTEGGYYSSLITFAAYGGAGYGISRFIRAYDTYNQLLELKRQHRLAYYRLRRWYQEPVSYAQDILWASGYIFAETCLPPAVTFVVISVLWNVGAAQAAPPLLMWIAAFAMLTYGAPFVFSITERLVYELFDTKRLEREINEAPQNFELLRIRQEEEREAQERLNGDENNRFPGGR